MFSLYESFMYSFNSSGVGKIPTVSRYARLAKIRSLVGAGEGIFLFW